ncbi:MAG: DUF4430 domain-containing protein [bacterium]|nr:DUF4430 domain-containing protein [bacterium]
MTIKPKYLLVAVGIIIALFAAIFGIYVSMPGTSAPLVAPAIQETMQDTQQENEVSFIIDGLYQGKQVSFLENETILDVMKTLNIQDPQVQLSTKEYAGLGTLIDGINGVTNGTDGKYWQYKVNGVMPQIGADAYILNKGDQIEWFFAGSEL